MTATHPPVIPLKPVRAGRPPAREPAPEVISRSPKVVAGNSEAIAPVIEAGDAAHVAARTRTIFMWVLIGIRIAALAALALVLYLAWSQDWVGSAADAAVTWYTTTVAPHLQVDFVGPEVPTVHDGLVGPMNEPSLVTTD